MAADKPAPRPRVFVLIAAQEQRDCAAVFVLAPCENRPLACIRASTRHRVLRVKDLRFDNVIMDSIVDLVDKQDCKHVSARQSSNSVRPQ